MKLVNGQRYKQPTRRVLHIIGLDRLILELGEPALGKLEGNLRMRTDHPRHPEIIVPVTGQVDSRNARLM